MAHTDTDLTPDVVLDRAESVTRARRQAAVDELQVCLDWAVLHSTEPARQHPQGDRLVQVGGDGTPLVRDLCFGELAIARQAGEVATRNRTADALDLAHRLPLLWRATKDHLVEPWVACKVARQTRDLSAEGAADVDAQLAGLVHESPGRMLQAAEAAIHVASKAEEVEESDGEQKSELGVWISRIRDLDGDPDPTRSDQRLVIGRIKAADAVWADATLERIADILATRPEHADTGRDELRALAFGILVRPHEYAALLGVGVPGEQAESMRPRATVHVHIAPNSPLARVEDYGPFLVRDLADLLGHARITLQPVIDLNTGHSVNGYETPAATRRRSRLRSIYDTFPHSSSTSSRVEHDHVRPYETGEAGATGENGETTGSAHSPPGQTGDHNTQPLTRRHHRLKTHAGYRVKQLGHADYLWLTPHGLARRVDQTGTRTMSRGEGRLLFTIAEDYQPN